MTVSKLVKESSQTVLISSPKLVYAATDISIWTYLLIFVASQACVPVM